MTDEIREKAQELINYLKSDFNGEFHVIGSQPGNGWLKDNPKFKALEQALKPSKEEVADYLAFEVRPDYGQQHTYQKWIDHAIEYLREMDRGETANDNG